MPRDSSGNYSLPALGNPAVTQTPITIAWWNGTSTDMAVTLTDSLSRSGLGGMLVPFKLVDGTAAAPAFSFQSEANTGFYRAAAGEMDVSVGGTRFSRWTSGGFQGSVDGGSTWKFPVYQNLAGQSMGASGALDFAAGKLTIASVAVTAGLPVAASSTSSGSFTTAATSYTAVNSAISFTANGRPVLVQLLTDTPGNVGHFSSVPTASAVVGGFGSIELAVSADAGSTFIGEQRFDGSAIWNGINAYNAPVWGPGSYNHWYTPAAGAATVRLYARATPGAAATVFVTNCLLLLIQF